MKLHEHMPELYGATTWLNGRCDREDLIGVKPTLIHFWSISCRACKEKMPYLTSFQNRYKDRLNMIAVHMPRSEEDRDLQQIKKVAAQHGMTQSIFVDDNLTLTEAFGNQFVPAYYVFDKEGRLRHFQTDQSGMNMLKKRIDRLLNEMKR
ncbi:TlpA family protein disulfide reductase [Sporosarcina luteola]|uniref:TlpA family protein disulfide reductase n=1 Tax=Sporosarcina luteola TaxID=582850 RepID=UPI00203FE280|nr:TlpA disulfide reductase family protein [Sporosarcina luteola]MCM3742688.1 TlpA family protein disulfide reductase [Sporosarcina luteola]